jgi:hypothetical protein
MTESLDPGDRPDPDDVLAAVERALDRATFKLGRLRSHNRGSGIFKELTSVSYDIAAARHDIVRLRSQLDEDAG